MPKNFGFKEKVMHALSEISPVDSALRKRAEWFLKESGLEKHLKAGDMCLDVGTGKGHIVQEILADMENSDRSLKGYLGIDIADKPLRKVQNSEAERLAIIDENPLQFSWASADELPFQSEVFDAVSYIFSIHHMSQSVIDKVMSESMRVLKPGGLIFVAEDLVDSTEQREITEAIDRKLNWESSETEHSYRSDEEWTQYFSNLGLDIVEKRFFESPSKKGSVKHGFYVLKLGN